MVVTRDQNGDPDVHCVRPIFDIIAYVDFHCVETYCVRPIFDIIDCVIFYRVIIV